MAAQEKSFWDKLRATEDNFNEKAATYQNNYVMPKFGPVVEEEPDKDSFWYKLRKRENDFNEKVHTIKNYFGATQKERLKDANKAVLRQGTKNFQKRQKLKKAIEKVEPEVPKEVVEKAAEAVTKFSPDKPMIVTGRVPNKKAGASKKSTAKTPQQEIEDHVSRGV